MLSRTKKTKILYTVDIIMPSLVEALIGLMIAILRYAGTYQRFYSSRLEQQVSCLLLFGCLTFMGEENTSYLNVICFTHI